MYDWKTMYLRDVGNKIELKKKKNYHGYTISMAETALARLRTSNTPFIDITQWWMFNGYI